MSSFFIAVDPDAPFVKGLTAEDSRLKGWAIDSDVLEPGGEKDIIFGLKGLLKPPDKAFLLGSVIKNQARILGADLLGRCHASAMLKDQYLIPKGWQQFTLLFPGIIWINEVGEKKMLCLFWHEPSAQWMRGFRGLEKKFSVGACRLVCELRR
ncbi:MAG: hypothetical protein HQ530_00155 [Parcubacteria group bacterium]|nr:hypothetical protein [Parcubacteria group bacterium]